MGLERNAKQLTFKSEHVSILKIGCWIKPKVTIVFHDVQVCCENFNSFVNLTQLTFEYCLKEFTNWNVMRIYTIQRIFDVIETCCSAFSICICDLKDKGMISASFLEGTLMVNGWDQSWKCTSAKGTGQCFSASVPRALKFSAPKSQCWH